MPFGNAAPAGALFVRAVDKPEHVVNASAQACQSLPHRPRARCAALEAPFLVDTLARRAVQSAGTRARLLFVKRIYGLNFLPCGGCATVLAPLLGYHVTPAPMAFPVFW